MEITIIGAHDWERDELRTVGKGIVDALGRPRHGCPVNCVKNGSRKLVLHDEVRHGEFKDDGDVSGVERHIGSCDSYAIVVVKQKGARLQAWKRNFRTVIVSVYLTETGELDHRNPHTRNALDAIVSHFRKEM